MTQDRSAASDPVAHLSAAFESYLVAMGKRVAPEDAQARDEQDKKVGAEAARLVRWNSKGWDKPGGWAGRKVELATLSKLGELAGEMQAILLAAQERAIASGTKPGSFLEHALEAEGFLVPGEQSLSDVVEALEPLRIFSTARDAKRATAAEQGKKFSGRHIAEREPRVALAVARAAKRLAGTMPSAGFNKLRDPGGYALAHRQEGPFIDLMRTVFAVLELPPAASPTRRAKDAIKELEARTEADEILERHTLAWKAIRNAEAERKPAEVIQCLKDERDRAAKEAREALGLPPLPAAQKNQI